MAYRVVHYINQFFAGIGGEERADYPPEVREGIVGPGQALQSMDEAIEKIIDLIKGYRPDAFVAGPAFNAGRYGMACGAICDAVSKRLNIPVVTAMYPENPAVEIYRKGLYIVETADSARGMRDAIPRMAKLLLKQLKGEPIGRPKEDGYIERGIRFNIFRDKLGAERAVDMLVKKLKGEEFVTEYPMPSFDRVPPAPAIKDMKKAKIALVTSGGIVPKGNPDRIEASSATKFGEYSLEGLDDLTPQTHETAHGGYDPTYANEDPDRVLPLDVARQLEREGAFGSLHDKYYATVGNGTPVAYAKKFGEEIAKRLKAANVDGVILTST